MIDSLQGARQEIQAMGHRYIGRGTLEGWAALVSVPSFLHSPLATTSVISLVIVGQSVEWHSFGEVDAAPEQAFSSAHCRLLPVAKPFTPRCSESEPKA